MRPPILLLVVALLVQSHTSATRPRQPYAPLARIDEEALRGLVDDPLIESFDLSPDGRTVALLVASGLGMQAPLVLVKYDVATKHFGAAHPIGHVTIENPNFSPQVLYAGAGKYLVIHDFREVRVLDAATLQVRRTIGGPPDGQQEIPLFIAVASGTDVVVCAFGPAERSNPRFHMTAVHVEVVDASSGARLGEWSSADVPQAISADGQLIAVSSLYPIRGLLPLDIVDVHGSRVASLADGFGFDGSGPSVVGRVCGIFVGTRELLLTADGTVDRAGHHSSDTIELVSIVGQEAHVKENLEPPRYGSQGALAVSATGETAVAVSWYLPPAVLAQTESPVPASSPELLVFQRHQSFRLDAVLTLPMRGGGLRTMGWPQSWLPRLSADGSVIAIAQYDAIELFSK
jgi:hypothetical protein